MFATIKNIKNSKRGFSLIELLVVIVIIAMLSAIVLAALSKSREKSRDAKRIYEVGQIQLALELYFDGARSYPSTTPATFSGTDAAVKLLEQKLLMKITPIPPSGGSPRYIYNGVYFPGGVRTACDSAAPSNTLCPNYSLGITLERSDSGALKADADQTLGTIFYGASEDCVTAPAGGAELCYDTAK